MMALIIYVSSLILISCLLFFTGFFPTKPVFPHESSIHDLPKSVLDQRLHVEQLYRKQYGKVVLMIVDAMRLDFISKEEGMPFLSKLLRNENSSCFIALRTDAPTVTLPRIKAIVTGTVPGFLDVIYNFGTNVLVGDSVIAQAYNHGRRIAFYGDDTWLRLFPKEFVRYEGTSSFFVNDFHEVDDNVTKNVKDELTNSDWDLLILHYLGLDHIGHVEGPYSRLILDKLKEMDDIVKEIFYSLQLDGNEGSSKGLLILTGDHGMKNSGGHGGSSYEEVTVPFILINGNCDSVSTDFTFNQIDVAPFLATILGVPIPAGSTGQLNPKWLGGLHANESLYATYYNTLRMKKDFSSDWNDEMEVELDAGLSFYYASVKTSFKSDDAKKAATHFLIAQKLMSTIRNQGNDIDFIPVLEAILLLVQALIFLFADVHPDPSHMNVVHGPVANRFNTGLFKLSLLISSSLVLLLTWSQVYPTMKASQLGYVTTITAILIGCNIKLLHAVQLTFKALSQMGYNYLPMVILYPFIFISTSLIEEEHHFWYYSFVTLLIRIFFQDIRTLDTIIVVLLTQRFLKTMNKNGDKWSHLPALGDWLESGENQYYLHFLYLTGLAFSILAIVKYTVHSEKPFFLDVAFTIVQGVMAYLYNRAIHRITLFPSVYPKSSGEWEVKIFWIFVLWRSIFTILKIFLKNTNGSRFLLGSSTVFSLLVQLHLSALMILVKPRNILLAPALVLFSSLLVKTARNSCQLQVLHYWLGMVFYFYMGNTNSISSIDVSVAFVGLDEFNFLLAGLFVCLHTYAYPILAFLLLATQLAIKSPRNFGHEFRCIYLLLNGLPLLVFMILTVIHREHLFIWSVFSPKLLYLLFQNVLFVVLVLFYCFLDRVH